jgi:hypothetical protein
MDRLNAPADPHRGKRADVVRVNRGHNSIAVFSVAEKTGALRLGKVISTEGDWPRNFSLHPTGRWLLVANQPIDSVVVLRVIGQRQARPHATTDRDTGPSACSSPDAALVLSPVALVAEAASRPRPNLSRSGRY